MKRWRLHQKCCKLVYNLQAGMNNIGDKKYFTLRADEYPGPGIIPSIGRSFYIGISAKF